MAVGIVTFEKTVVDPQNLFQSELGLQIFFDVVAAKLGVSVWRQQASRSRHQSAPAVAFDRASFEHKSAAVHCFGEKAAVDEIVFVGGEFHTPAVESEVEEAQIGAVFHSYGAIVASPGVVSVVAGLDYLHSGFGNCRDKAVVA